MERALKRVKAVKQGQSAGLADDDWRKASSEQMEKILSYLDIEREGAEVLIGGKQAALEGDLKGGYYIEPTVFKGTTRCASSRRRYSGRWFQ